MRFKKPPETEQNTKNIDFCELLKFPHVQFHKLNTNVVKHKHKMGIKYSAFFFLLCSLFPKYNLYIKAIKTQSSTNRERFKSWLESRPLVSTSLKRDGEKNNSWFVLFNPVRVRLGSCDPQRTCISHKHTLIPDDI